MDYEAIFTGIAVVVSILIYGLGRRNERRLRQADLLRAYTNDFYQDPSVTAIFMAVDYERYLLTEEDYDTEAELSLIRLLDFLNIVGHNWKRGVLDLTDIVPTTVGYAAVRVHRDPIVKKYLARTKRWDDELYNPDTGFRYFEQLAEALEETCAKGRQRKLRMTRVHGRHAASSAP